MAAGATNGTSAPTGTKNPLVTRLSKGLSVCPSVAPLGRFSYRVAMSVGLSVCVRHAPGAQLHPQDGQCLQLSSAGSERLLVLPGGEQSAISLFTRGKVPIRCR